MIRCCYCTKYAKCEKEEKGSLCEQYKCCKYYKERERGLEEIKRYKKITDLVLVKDIPFLNTDGIIKRKTVEGLKEYLRYARREGISVFREEFNLATILFADLNRVPLFSRNMKRFSKMFYWFLGYREDWDSTEERYFLNSEELWDRLNKKRFVAHPDRGEIKDCSWIYQLNKIKGFLEKRKQYVC